MRKLILTFVIGCASFEAAYLMPACAEPIAVTITNKTPEVIKTITAVPRAGGAVIEVSKADIAIGGVAPVEFEAASSTCVFTLKSLLASGKTLVNEGVFLCHTKEVVIQ